MDMSIPVAFIAGMASFFAPCVVPIMPVFMSYMLGSSMESVSTKVGLWRLSTSLLIFALGFGTVFISVGLGVRQVVGPLFRSGDDLLIVVGVVVLLSGLSFLNLIHLPLPSVATHTLPLRQGFRLLNALILGALIGFIWSPCVGPVLGAILSLAATAHSFGQALGLLLAYTIGLLLPFFIVPLGVARYGWKLPGLTRHAARLRIVSGVILVMFGLLLINSKLLVGPVWLNYLTLNNWIMTLGR